MYCKKCGKEIANDSIFCSYCGTEQKHESRDYFAAHENNMGYLEDLDPIFEQAASFIVSTGQASTATLQRKFSLGYNRAGHLMNQLERVGIVGAALGYKPREVLINDMESLRELLQCPTEKKNNGINSKSKILETEQNNIDEQDVSLLSLQDETHRRESKKGNRYNIIKGVAASILILAVVGVIIFYLHPSKSVTINDKTPHTKDCTNTSLTQNNIGDSKMSENGKEIYTDVPSSNTVAVTDAKISRRNIGTFELNINLGNNNFEHKTLTFYEENGKYYEEGLSNTRTELRKKGNKYYWVGDDTGAYYQISGIYLYVGDRDGRMDDLYCGRRL